MDLKNLNKDKKDRRRATPDLSTMMYGKVPPQAKDLEDAILGAILLERDAFDAASGILRSECFYVESNQRIFSAAQALAAKGQPIDLLTIVEELKMREELDMVGGPYYVAKLTNGVTSSANIIAHSRIVLQKFIQREMIRISGEIIGDAYENSIDVFELLEQAETKILEIGTANIHGEMIGMSQALVNTLEKIEDWRKIEGSITGIPSGFAGLDQATRGWQPGDLIIIGARPSVGKTALALNLIRNAALGPSKTTVAIWSLEMKHIYLVLRMLAAESKTYMHKLQTGSMDDDEMKMLHKTGVSVLSKANIFFDDNTSITLSALSAKARRLKKKNKLGLIVIDYLQLMGSSDQKSGNREQEIAKISRGLKNLAQELEIPIIALSQLARESAKTSDWDYGPPISSLRESGAIEQDADVIIMVWAPSDDDKAKNPTLDGKRKARVAKQRNGVLITEEFNFKNEIQLFETIEKVTGNWKAVSDLPVKNTEDFTQPKKKEEPDDLPF